MSQLHFKRLLKEWPGERMRPHAITWGERVKGLEDAQDELQGFVEEAISHTYVILAGAYSYTCIFILCD